MKELMSVLRLALTLIALPLMATAAVSAHQYFASNQPLVGGESALVSKPVMAGTFRNHTVSLDSDGVVRGRVGSVADGAAMTGLGNMKVFFLQNGKIALQTYTAADGSFEANGLAAGLYSFVTVGTQGFAAFGVELSEDKEVNTNNIMEIGTVNPSQRELTNLLKKSFPSEVTDAIAETKFAGQPISGSNRVQLVDGKLSGQLVNLFNRVLEGSKVKLLRGQELIAEGVADTQGAFAFEGLQPGVYEFVSAGPAGIAALSFEAVTQESVVDPGTTVSQTLDVPPTSDDDEVVVWEQIDEIAYVNTPMESYGFAGTEIGYGGAMGGYSGATGSWGGFGGPGGGFGGGLASLGRFAVLGWILTELFDNIDFEGNENLPPVSPRTL